MKRSYLTRREERQYLEDTHRIVDTCLEYSTYNGKSLEQSIKCLTSTKKPREYLDEITEY